MGQGRFESPRFIDVGGRFDEALQHRQVPKDEVAQLLPRLRDARSWSDRVPSVPREHLLEVAEDVAADVRVRVSAIEALAGQEDDDTRERLELVATATASPEVQRAVTRLRET